MATKKKPGEKTGATKKSVAARKSKAAIPPTKDSSNPVQRLVVRGQVRLADGTPLAGALVRAYDKDLRSKEQLGKSEPVITDTKGRYEIPYAAEQFSRAEKRGADLLVEARQNEEAGWIVAPTEGRAQR